MPQVWGPTAPGKLFTSTQDWSLSLDNDQFELVVAGRKTGGSALLLERLTAERGAFWATVKVPLPSGQAHVLDGIPNAGAEHLLDAVTASIKSIRHRQIVAELLQDFGQTTQPVIDWAHATRQACKTQLRSRGWLSHEFRDQVNHTKPQGFAELLAFPEVAKHLESQSKEIRESVALYMQPFADVADGINQRHLAKELIQSKRFFDKVEKSPLTEEQVKAVVSFDNRVLLVASAGSGKTSTMVAKAGYGLKNGYFAADRTLLLAFNNDAATELRERIKARLEPLVCRQTR